VVGFRDKNRILADAGSLLHLRYQHPLSRLRLPEKLSAVVWPVYVCHQHIIDNNALPNLKGAAFVLPFISNLERCWCTEAMALGKHGRFAVVIAVGMSDE
jgi:hypothetical protein